MRWREERGEGCAGQEREEREEGLGEMLLQRAEHSDPQTHTVHVHTGTYKDIRMRAHTHVRTHLHCTYTRTHLHCCHCSLWVSQDNVHLGCHHHELHCIRGSDLLALHTCSQKGTLPTVQ